MTQRRLLVTGGSGTFGRAFIRRALADPAWSAVVSFSRDEQKAAALVQEFGDWRAFKAFLGDVRDSTRLGLALRGVDTVVHAAALKRVDVGAYSPSELIATNIIGTMNVVNAAIHASVRRVVVLSSDKAVMPTNLYGATKHVAESYAVQANAYGYPAGTRVAAVRYGNILGSRGSVIHTWRDQIRRGVPLVLTDRRMTRFVMTIEQAADLVDYAIRYTQAGEVFVPVLPSARLQTLAEAVLLMDGKPGWEFADAGLRPGGEKLAERLLSDEEGSRARTLGGVNDGTPHISIAPSHHEWVGPSFQWYGSAATLDGFQYASDGERQRFLTAAELVALMAGTEALA